MKTQKRQIKFLERAEVERLIGAIDTTTLRGLRDRALLTVLFSTGMRIHEALELKTKDFERWDKGTKELTIIGKGDWQRVVYFSPKAVEAIQDYMIASPKDPDGLLFPITARAAQIMIKKRASEAGIEKLVTPHKLRHSFATDLLSRGVDIRMVQEFLGHRSITSTQVYTHVTSKQLRDVHEKLYK